MRRLVPFLILVALACGEAEPPAPAPGPTIVEAPEPDAGPGPFTLATRPGTPGRPPPVLLVGDVRDVIVSVARLVDPEPPIGWDGPGKVVFERPAKADRWSFLPPLPMGIYRVTATRGEEKEEQMLVVTDLAVIVERAAREALVWVVDANDGSPVASARVVIRHGGANRDSATDRNGVLRFEVPGGEKIELLVTRNGRVGHAVDEGSPTKELVTHLMLDRTDCEPGDEIRVAGVYRKRNGDYSLVEAPRLRLLVRDERGSLVAEAEPEEHRPGFFHGRLRLPLEPPAGPLDLVADFGDAEESVRIPIPRRPDVGFSARLLQGYWGGAGTNSGYWFYLGARDTTGRRLAGARVRYRVERLERGRYVPVLEGRGLLPADDVFTWNLEQRPAGPCRIRASVIDRNGLSAECEEELGFGEPAEEVLDSDIPLSVDPEVAEPGAEVRVTIPVTADLPEGSILLTMKGRSLGPHTVEILSGDRYETTFRVPDHPGAVLTFAATTVRGRRVLRGVAKVVVDSGPRKLGVDVAVEGDEVVVTVDGEVPESARGLVAVSPWSDGTLGGGIEHAFYDGMPDRFLRIEATEDSQESDPTDLEVSEPPDGPTLWWTNVRFTEGKAVLPLDLPEDGGRYLVDVAVATADHRFGSALRLIDRPGKPTPARTPPTPPASRLRSRSRPGPLPSGSSGCSLALPMDATDARLEILVTRGPLAAVARAARAEMSRSLETTDGAIASFLPALLVWRSAREHAAGLGIHEADVRAAARAALARIFARQAEDGGFAPWDGALADTATTARVVLALLDARHWVEVDEERIRRAMARLGRVESSDDATAALVFHAQSGDSHRFRARVGKRFPAESWEHMPPRALARLLYLLPYGDEPTALRTFAALRRRAHRGPGEALSWSDAPGRDVETTSIVVANLIEDVDGAVRFLLDRRIGPSWADPRTATAAARALLSQITTVTPEEGEPIPLRIRVESGLVAAVTLTREELGTVGRSFVVEDGSVPRGRFEVEFTRGGAGDVDVVAWLTWRAATDGPEADDAVAIRSGTSRITLAGRTPLDGPADRGDTLLMAIEVETKQAVGPFAVDVPLAAGTIALPARVFDVGTPPGIGRTDRADRVRFLCPALPAGGRTKLELVVRTTFAGTFVLRSATATGLESGTHLGSAESGQLEVR